MLFRRSGETKFTAVLEAVTKAGVAFDMYTYHYIISFAARRGALAELDAAFTHMLQAGVTPLEGTWIVVLRSLFTNEVNQDLIRGFVTHFLEAHDKSYMKLWEYILIVPYLA